MPLTAAKTRNFILYIFPAGSDQEFSKQNGHVSSSNNLQEAQH